MPRQRLRSISFLATGAHEFFTYFESPGGRTAQCSAAVFKRVSMRVVIMRVVIMRVVIAGAVAGRESVRTRVLMPKRSAESASFRKAAARPTKIPSRKHYFSDYYFKCTTFN